MTAIKLSRPSKMPCPSWSLQAIDTCPGSIDPTTNALVPACQGCYATDGNYRFPAVRATRAHNRQDWQRSEWTADMVDAITPHRYFRWFDSGDMYSLQLAEKLYQIMRETPATRHWLPTRMHKFPKFRQIIKKMRALPNVVVRVSSDSINGRYDKRQRHASTIIPFPDTPTTAILCGAYTRGGKCGDCRACWDPSIQAIAYPAHGRKMQSVIARSN